MRVDEWGGPLAVFVVVFAAVLLVGVVTSGGVTPKLTTEEPTSPGVLSPDENLVSEPADTGAVKIAEAASQQTILIDAAHQNTQVRDRTQVLTDVLTSSGHKVNYYSPENKIGQFEDRLAGADAIIIVAPTQQYTQAEQSALDDFIDEGGRAVFFLEPKRTRVDLFGEVTTRGRTASILTRYGVSPGAGYLYNLNGEVGNFRTITATPASNRSLADGIDNVTLYTSTSLTLDDETASVLETRPTTNSSTLRSNASYTVAAKQGNVVVVGDSEFLIEQNYRKSDNEELVGNIVEFLVDAK